MVLWIYRTAYSIIMWNAVFLCLVCPMISSVWSLNPSTTDEEKKGVGTRLGEMRYEGDALLAFPPSEVCAASCPLMWRFLIYPLKPHASGSRFYI